MNPSAQRIVLQIVDRMARHGTLHLTLSDGTQATLGTGAPVADLTIGDATSVPELVRHGTMGFAEAYMQGRIGTSDIAALVRWGAANHDAWFSSLPGRVLGFLRGVWLQLRPERRHPRVQTMADHYNLGNEFYATWLDSTFTYSSARFQQPDQPLDDAQRHKYATIAAHAGLQPGMRVLEIGCGWGGFAEYAAREIGCSVVGITIAQEQAEFARKRMADLGLTDRVEIRLEDFRDTRGEFDAVVSIEMIESIDERQWPALFATIAARLKATGRAVMQIITIDDALWHRYRTNVDFIQQYIFPGGQLPAPQVLRKLSADVDLAVEQRETFGLDYARTLDHWRERFAAAWPSLDGTDGLDQRFRRMWDLYLTLCAAAFNTGRIDVEQWVFAGAPRTV
jgi:cyclopropane-fatty-acyl-phospholipid synthase